MREVSDLLAPPALEAIDGPLAGGRKSVVRYPTHGCPVGGFDADANGLVAKARLAHPKNPMGDPPAIFDLDEGFSHERLPQSLEALPAQKVRHFWSSITGRPPILIELRDFCMDRGLRAFAVRLLTHVLA
jgi:hypothetical protein